MKYFFIFFFITSLSAAEITIGVSKSNFGPIKKQDVINILNCMTNHQGHHFLFAKWPTLRGLNFVKEKHIDAFYPIYVNHLNQNQSLFPIYIDELLLLSKTKFNLEQDNNIGVTRGDLDAVLNKYPRLKIVFQVENMESLLLGFKFNRVKGIVIYRSQLPPDFNLKPYHIQTLTFKEVGIQINDQFEKKTSLKQDLLQNKFLRCMADYDFPLSLSRKKAISASFLHDAKQLQSMLKIAPQIITNISTKDKKWQSGDVRLKKSLLRSPLSLKLKNILEDYKFINEAFLFNHQGGLLGSMKATSDFDQSDEEKFQIVQKFKNFTEKNISNIYFDASSKSFQVGIVIRLHDQNDKFAGGLYIGANINKLFTYYKLN